VRLESKRQKQTDLLRSDDRALCSHDIFLNFAGRSFRWLGQGKKAEGKIKNQAQGTRDMEGPSRTGVSDEGKTE
jgi:hypothetical protein